MPTTKVTFTLDNDTVARIGRTAHRLGTSKSAVVREAVREYAARAGRLSEAEREQLLTTFDAILTRPAARTARAVDREVAAVRAARRQGGRRTPPESG